jgi:hypothetical protein
VSAQVDLRLAVVDDVGVGDLDAGDLGRDVRAQALEHLDVGRALAVQFVALRAVADDRRLALEDLCPEPVLGMEVRGGEEQRPAACEPFGVLEHVPAVARPYARVDYQHGMIADDEADIRDQRHTAVGNHEYAVGDLGRLAPHDRRRGRLLREVGPGTRAGGTRRRFGDAHEVSPVLAVLLAE